MKALVFAPLHDTDGKADAREFQSEAHAFCAFHSITAGVRMFDNLRPMKDRLCQLRDWIEDEQPQSIDTLALFCHGWKAGVQAGARIEDAKKLTTSLVSICTGDLRVILYACSTGEGDPTGPGGEGGFADALRDELRKAGVRATVFAHTTEGHCTRNPWVRRFEPDEVAGGRYIVEPHSELWAEWAKSLRGDLRWLYPWMTQEQIEDALRGAPGVA